MSDSQEETLAPLSSVIIEFDCSFFFFLIEQQLVKKFDEEDGMSLVIVRNVSPGLIVEVEFRVGNLGFDWLCRIKTMTLQFYYR